MKKALRQRDTARAGGEADHRDEQRAGERRRHVLRQVAGLPAVQRRGARSEDAQCEDERSSAPARRQDKPAVDDLGAGDGSQHPEREEVGLREKAALTTEHQLFCQPAPIPPNRLLAAYLPDRPTSSSASGGPNSTAIRRGRASRSRGNRAAASTSSGSTR
ncbi:MAG: hypothetical protein M3N47_05015 [Chloroflexota bacterium]|nr:hypothetical protein [Chloroflexota bacterium]